MGLKLRQGPHPNPLPTGEGVKVQAAAFPLPSAKADIRPLWERDRVRELTLPEALQTSDATSSLSQAAAFARWYRS